MDRQIYAIVRAANFNLYRLGKVRGHLTTEATNILVHSLDITYLDYVISLLTGLPLKKLRPLQSVQDSAARLTYCGAITTEVSRFHLHWLPINFRVLFKILLLVFDCLQGTAPLYLRKCIQLHLPGHSGIPTGARSLGVMFSTTRRRKKKSTTPKPKPSYQKKSFTTCAPHHSNKLPPAIRSTTIRLDFKKLLRTHLYTLSYLALTARH
jgi:hypothetical protein